MLKKLLQFFEQIRQIEKKSVIIGLIIFIVVFYLLATPTIATASYEVALQETAQEEGYADVHSWKIALQDKRQQEVGSSISYILELDGYINNEDKVSLIVYEKGLTSAKSFAKFEEIYVEREKLLSEKRLNKENSEKVEIALSKGADLSLVDWSVGKDVFVEEWTNRINEFLEGSVLEGYGYNFAVASWNYCVDPRWSPAISFVESNKGKYCFRDYNAWGWGSVDWTNWEEAIDAHVKGLSTDYGYTLTERYAMSYCPRTWESWYWGVRNTIKII